MHVLNERGIVCCTSLSTPIQPRIRLDRGEEFRGNHDSSNFCDVTFQADLAGNHLSLETGKAG